MRFLGCQARARPLLTRMGWTCTGSHLTVLLLGPEGVPCVLPDRMVADALAGPGGSAYEPAPFAGGDHLHMVAPSPRVHA